MLMHHSSLVKDNPQPNYGNICTALELLAFLLSILRKETVLSTFRPLQRGIAACLTCNNTKVCMPITILDFPPMS